jgi:hypothetical protein
MSQPDMSAAAVTARLKLVSQLRRLCISLGTAKIDPRPLTKHDNMRKKAQDTPQDKSK